MYKVILLWSYLLEDYANILYAMDYLFWISNYGCFILIAFDY